MGSRQGGQWGHRDTAVSMMELGENAYLLQEPRDSGWDTARAWEDPGHEGWYQPPHLGTTTDPVLGQSPEQSWSVMGAGSGAEGWAEQPLVQRRGSRVRSGGRLRATPSRRKRDILAAWLRLPHRPSGFLSPTASNYPAISGDPSLLSAVPFHHTISASNIRR